MYYTFLLIHRERETEQNHVWTEESLSKGAYGGMYMYVTQFDIQPQYHNIILFIYYRD